MSKKICIHAGHNPDGKVACGAVGFMKESTAAREIVSRAIAELSALGYEVTDATCNTGLSQSDVLNKINKIQKSDNFDLCVSVHLNSWISNSANGAECYVYIKTSETAKIFAKNFVEAMGDLGYYKRGVKTTDTLSVIVRPSSPSVLCECGFVSSENDCKLYDAEKISHAICESIKKAVPLDKYSAEPVPDTSVLYTVQIIATKNREKAEAMCYEAKKMGFVDAFIRRS